MNDLVGCRLLLESLGPRPPGPRLNAALHGIVNGRSDNAARDVQSAGSVQLSCGHQTTRTMVPMTTFTPSPPPAPAAAIVVAAKLPAR